ncbi:MAG: Unknown protein [uncultured Sulfurovum sp.]|uniref:Uncharacterized protein n=1 Tax=uncultured Sulfurovum sp. TaxID=269237 RepID=A0A6S6SHP2_9BACT|nr:MAG: Unknown protein [uncultured Sulfurovum sp.]
MKKYDLIAWALIILVTAIVTIAIWGFFYNFQLEDEETLPIFESFILSLPIAMLFTYFAGISVSRYQEMDTDNLAH